MTEGGLFKIAVALAVTAFAVIVAGAKVVSQGACPVGSLSDDLHVQLSGITALLSLGLALGSFGRAIRSDLKILGIAVLLLVIGEVGLGFLRISTPGAKYLSIIHSSLAQILFAISATAAFALSPIARRFAGTPIADSGSPSLRTLGWITPAAVVLQMALGAIHRHGAAEVWPHILSSAFVGGLLCYSALAIYETPDAPGDLRLVAHAMIGFTLVQVLLGLGAYLGKSMASSDGPQTWMVHVTVAHVVGGALTMAAAFTFGLIADQRVPLAAAAPPHSGKAENLPA